MAQKVNIILVDDLDGSEATQTITFGLDGTDYEIDLNDKNADALRKAVEKFVGPARKVSGGRGRSSRRASSPSSSSDKTAVREWAKTQGMDVSERGRIPVEIQQAYDAAKGAEPKSSSGRSSTRKRTATVDESGKVTQNA